MPKEPETMVPVVIGVNDGKVCVSLGEWEMRLSEVEALQVADAIVNCAKMLHSGGKKGVVH